MYTRGKKGLYTIGVGSISNLGGGGGGGANVNIHCDAAICAACMNINKVWRVKYWGGPGPPCPWVPMPMYIGVLF